MAHALLPSLRVERRRLHIVPHYVGAQLKVVFHVSM